MDDIYDNLENYNDINTVEELRSENKELKTKLERCTSEMERLQKDFDKMAGEFKKLEMNYSSLLKTARAEIERKTHTIKNLNIEKDIMILNSLQNVRQSKFKVQKEADNKLRNNSESECAVSKKHQAASKEKPHTRRVPEKRVPSEDTISSLDADNKTKVSRVQDSKVENEGSANHKPQTKALGIASRRKSMPVLNKEYSNLSSDEEYEDSGGTINEKRYPEKISVRSRTDKERFYNEDKRRDKSIGNCYGKYDNYESRESGFRYRNNKFERDKLRKADESETRQRNKRYYSPKRSYRRDNRDIRDSNHCRSNYGRGRELVSPDHDKYNRKRSRERRSIHNRDSQNNYNRDAHDKYGIDTHNDYDRDVFEIYQREVDQNCDRDINENFDENEHHYKEKQFIRDKVDSDSDEPQSKRLKSAILEKFTDEDLITDTNHLISCESPDYVSADNASATLPVKEIMDTAATQLEDPRLASKKYRTIKSGDNFVLSTVTGRNIELEIVNTTTWDMVNIPRPLLYASPQLSEQIVREIQMDLDNPVSNITIDSGEIPDCEINNELIDIPSKNMLLEYGIDNKKLSAEMNVVQELNKNTENIEHYTKTCFQKYKIPKIQKQEDSSAQVKESINKRIQKESSQELQISATTKKDFQNNTRDRKISQNSLSDVTSEENIHIDKEDLSYVPELILNREIVKNDLELSDDNMVTLIEEKIKKGSSSKKEKLKKTYKQKKSKKVCDNADSDNNTKTKKIEGIPEEIKTKFSDLFGDNSSLITPEDLQAATTEVHGENKLTSQLDKYIDDTQNAIDLNFDVITKTKSNVCGNTKADLDHTSNSIAMNPCVTSKLKFVDSSHMISNSSQDSIKSKKLIKNDKSGKTAASLENVNSSEESDKKTCRTHETSKKNKRNRTKSPIVPQNKNVVDLSKDVTGIAEIKKGHLKSSETVKDTSKKKSEVKSKLCKLDTESNRANIESDNTSLSRSLKVYDLSDHKPTTTTRVEKTEGNSKPKFYLASTETDSMKPSSVASETKEVEKNEEINCNVFCNEPGVKTVVISTGFQKHASREPKLECKLSKAQNDLVTVLKIKEHSLKALATSTPQKESIENPATEDKILEPISSSNNTCLISDNSGPVVNDTNDNDVPDIRIFVKRRRKVIKKVQ